MATFTIDEITLVRTISNIDDNDVFELQIKDGGSDDLKSAKITKAELMKAFNDGSTPLRYKALISQNAPVATTQTPTIIAGQIWEDTIGTANAGDLVILGGYELISGTLGAVNAKYRSATDDTPNFTTASLAYDGSPYIVSTDVNGDFNPSINTLGGTPVFSYVDTGEYTCTLANAFPASKTYPKLNIVDADSESGAFRQNNNELTMFSATGSGVYADNKYNYTPFEIEIYP